MSTAPRVDYQTHPSQYRHWKLSFDGPVATLKADFDENGGLRPGYKLKLNSYDLGVDIELNDAVNRIRFEHPEVRTVVVTSAKDKVFCSGANIFMLGVSSHAWKVNFCKFTNETRNGLEDSSTHSGLTRVTDKRKVRHDLADLFCTSVEGVRGQKAKDWRLVDEIAKPAVFAQKVQERALALAAGSDRPADGKGVELTPVQCTIEGDRLVYPNVVVDIDRARRVATFTVKAPVGEQPTDIAGIEAAGAGWYALAMARELEDAILSMRTNELDIGTWLVKTEGSAAAVLALDAVLMAHKDHWLVRETIGLLRRTFSRLDVSSRSLFALVDEGTCFAGSFLELALACDRIYHLALPDADVPPTIAVGDVNFGLFPMVTGQSRLERRFYGEQPAMEAVRSKAGQALDADAAFALGLVTSNPDDIDWADETRIAIEERVAMSPDALTGLEANLRFNGPENMFTRIFGRLTAWQNWIFQRPNAVGDKGALKVYGKGDKAAFDWNRV